MKSIEKYRVLFDKAMEKELEALGGESYKGLYEPVKYIFSIGGKRIRPALLLLATSLYRKDVSVAIPAAIAIEIFHNFTLLHDDIMDHASMRRGSKTVHEKYDENTAILSGDAMSILAYKFLGKLPASHLSKALSIFSNTALEVCEGQQLDIEFENRQSVSVDEYINMIRLKTAVLLACSLKLGAIIGNAVDEDVALLYKFGINIGIAFQLRDDWLDVYGNSDIVGKEIGGDIRSNKKTYLFLKALKLSDKDQAAQLQYQISDSSIDSDKRVETVTRIYNETGAGEYVKKEILRYHQKALEYLEKLTICDEKNALREIADMIISRIC